MPSPIHIPTSGTVPRTGVPALSARGPLPTASCCAPPGQARRRAQRRWTPSWRDSAQVVGEESGCCAEGRRRRRIYPGPCMHWGARARARASKEQRVGHGGALGEGGGLVVLRSCRRSHPQSDPRAKAHVRAQNVRRSKVQLYLTTPQPDSRIADLTPALGPSIPRSQVRNDWTWRSTALQP